MLNYEGRRDASSTSINRNVPTENLKQGIVTFHDATGALKTIGPDQIKSIVDPLGIGVDQAALAVLKQYPVGNNSSLGDGLNFTGYTFNAPIHSKQDTYTAKLDYKVDQARQALRFLARQSAERSRHSSSGTPQFPGRAAQFGHALQQQGHGERA